MAIDVFNRYENKYLLDHEAYCHFEQRLLDYMELDRHNKLHPTYTIANIYYDTENDDLIRTSLAKPKYKEKLRLRGYGIPESDAKVYVEMKKKVNKLVNKRRTSMKLDEAYDFLQTGKVDHPKPYMNTQVLKELEYFLTLHDVQPKLYLAYDRRAFFGKEDKNLRISFDTRIRTRRTELTLEAGDHGELLVEEGKWIMEIKVLQSIPLWLTRLLSEFQLIPMSFSKYGTEFKKYLANKEMREKQIRVVESVNKTYTIPSFVPISS